MITPGNEELELCSVPRWQQYKSLLVNLCYDEFVQQAGDQINSILLDVRTAQEFEVGTIPGAINLNYLSPTLADHIEALDKTKKYFVFCRTGRRSLRVCMLLKNIGVTAYNLDAGLRSSPISC